MPYVLPEFNLVCDIWRNGLTYYDPPSVGAVPCNLAPGRLIGTNPPEGVLVPIGTGPMWLRLPKGTDIRDIKAAAGEDLVVVPSGSWRQYRVAWVDDIGGGFTNEHRFACIQSVGPWPTPFPACTGPFPPPPPGPASLLAQATSSGALVNALPFTFTPPASGLIFVVVQWSGMAPAPALGVGGNLLGSAYTWMAGLTQMNGQVYVYAFNGLASPATVQFGIGQTAAVQVIALALPWATGIVAVNQNKSNQFGQPILNGAAPVPVAQTWVWACVGFNNPPAGYAPASPFTEKGRISDTIGGQTVVLASRQYTTPFILTPSYTETPMMGPWNNWGGNLIYAH